MAQFTTPGVYVEEVPSGVRVITGVATSITAFVGRALRGPTDTDAASPVRITNFAGYERIFGGLWAESPMSFAVQQFFANGGTEALIVRIHRHAKTARVRVPLSNGARVAFVAANPGAWGARVRIRIDHEVESVAAAAEPPDTLFNLHIRDLDTDVTEVHAAVSCVAGHPRFVSTVLAQTSGLLRGPATLASRPRASPPSTGPDVFAARGTRALTVAAEPDGTVVDAARLYAGRGLRTGKRGLYRLDHADRINLLVVPPYRFGSDLAKQDWDAVVAYASSRHAIALVDAPAAWTRPDSVDEAAIGQVVTRSANAALTFPRLLIANPLQGGQAGAFAPSGAVAGLFARIDAARGVWKAAAGVEAVLRGVVAPTVVLTDGQQGFINPLGVNCVRQFPAGVVLWGARTLLGDDAQGSEWKYLPVRRLALFLDQSLRGGLGWVVFEPNDEPLWAQVRLAVETFLESLFRRGAFQGGASRDAYFVRCDRSTMSPADIADGRLRVLVGFAPLRPAEFVILDIRQRTAVGG